ncbi:MAG: oligosaccharide flippase family protein, partial [Solirubrobacterales bacterium]|nr:oligosaccharide flippase family protein [Solirubrobacterales bacterium]
METEQQPTHVEELESDLLDTPAAGPAAIRGSALRAAGYIAGILLSLASVPLLIRHLGESDYGRYVLVISLVTIVQGITDVGLGQIGVREYSTRPPPERGPLMRNLLGVRFTMTALGIVLGCAFAVIAGYGEAVILGTLFAGLGMVLTVVQGTFAVPLAAQLRLGWVTGLDLLRQLLAVSAIVILVLVGAKLLAFFAVLVPVALAVLAATVALVRGTMPLRPTFQRDEWAALLRAVLPFAAAVVIGSLYLRLTVVLMSLLASSKQTGYYAIGFSVISVLIAIPALTVGSALPVLARAARDDSERLSYVLSRLMEITLIVGVGLALMLALGADFVVRVLAGTGGPAVAVLRIQSIALVTVFVSSSLQYGLLALHRHRQQLIMSATGLLVSAVLTLVLVPVLAAEGAALAFVGGETVLLVYAFVFLRSAHPTMRFSMRVPVRVAAATALAGLVALIPGLGSLPSALLAGVVYFGVLAATGAIPAELKHA